MKSTKWFSDIRNRNFAASFGGQAFLKSGRLASALTSRARLLGLLSALLTIFAVSDARAQSGVTISELVSMPWQIALVGNTGCGPTSMLFAGNLSPNPSGNSGVLFTSSGCGPSSGTQAFTITSLNADGSGTANLSCGPGCGWNFAIQVNNLFTFNLVDVTNGGNNVLAGTAIAQGGGNFPGYPLSEFAGTWQIDLVGNTGCGHSSMAFTGTLNASGTGKGTLTGESGCGSSSSTQTFTVTPWNPVTNSGIATLSCGSGCGWTFNIELNTGAGTFNLVDVENGGNNVLAGTAVRVSAGSTMTLNQLAGPWRIALIGNTGCGVSAMEFTGVLNAAGSAPGTLTSSSGCGSSTSNQTFTITSLSGNGSGAATLSCGPGCGWTFDFQVDALKWTFNLVDVTNGPNNVLAGTGMARYRKTVGYITNTHSNTVSVIDANTNTVVGQPVRVGQSPFGVAVHPNGSRVYVTDSGDGGVSVIDTASNSVVAVASAGRGPLGVAVHPSGSPLYVANSDDNTVSVIDTASNLPIATVPVGKDPTGVVVAPNGNRVFVTNRLDDYPLTLNGSVSVIDTVSNSVIATVPVGKLPYGMVWGLTNSGPALYVVNQGDNTVSVIDPVLGFVVNTVPVGFYPGGVAVTPDGRQVYVANAGDNSVSVIGTATNTVFATVPMVGSGPLGVAATPDGSRVEVADFAGQTVSVIDTAVVSRSFGIVSNAVVATVQVGTNPAAFGNFITVVP